MSHTAVARTAHRSPRRVLAPAAIIAGAALTVVGLSAGPASADELPTQTVPLNNQVDNVQVLENCPNATDDFWHFVTTPNDDSYRIVSITLHLGDATPTFTGADIIPNTSGNKVQLDNVFVQVPDGYTLYDLEQNGSSAEIAPDTGDVKFVLSHLCDGSTETTTTTVAETTTTVAETTTTAPTTTEGPTTTEAQSPTTTLQAQSGPTPTLTGSSGATIPPEQVELPKTGPAGTGAMVALGSLLMVIGLALVGLTRRTTA